MIVEILAFLFRIAVFAAGIYVFFKLRKVQALALRKWSRRFGLIFFLAPLIVWIGYWIVPEGWLLPFQILDGFATLLDMTVAALTGVSEEQLGGFWAFCLRPLFSGVVYAAAGALLGWPLDAWKKPDPSPEVATPAPGAAGAP